MVIAIAAISLDGCIAFNSTDPVSWGSKEDNQLFASETKKSGVVVMGRTTWETINRPLSDRHIIVLTTRPKHYQSPSSTVEFTNLPPIQLIKKLKSRNFSDIFIAGGNQIYTLFLNEKLVDQIWITIEPYLIGHPAINLLSKIINPPIKLTFIKSKLLNDNTLHLKYRILY